MKHLTIIIGMLILTSCALPQRKQVLVDVEAQEVKVETRSDRILKCVDKYRGEGLKSAYAVCKDLHTLE